MNVRGTTGGRALARAAIVLLALSALATLHGVTSVQACDCPEPPPPTDALEDADAVFAGEVTSLREVGDEGPGPWLLARIEVTEVWKGEVHEVVEVRTHAHGATCGYGFEEGRADIVYASIDDEGRFRTNLCARTAPLDQADEDLAALGDGEQPRRGDAVGEVDDGRAGWLVGLAAVALAGVLLASGAWARRRGRRRSNDRQRGSPPDGSGAGP